MSGLFLKFFGPLDKSACVYFLAISAIFFILLLLTIGKEIIYILRNYKSINFKIFTGGLLLIFNLFLAYVVNRLLYTMCNKSLA